MSTAVQVLDVLATVTETDEIREHPDLRLYDAHLLDSFKTIELMVALSDQFGVELSPAEFERDQWATPSAIIAYMENKLRA